jgi:prepilin-type N-terminal cleavage/methylation domain-containing protein
MMRSQKGFSLIELLVATAVLLLMMAGVFSQIAKLQKVAQQEDVKRDMFQNGREVMDQFNRDLHSAGFPNKNMYNRSASNGVFLANPDSSTQSAVGLILASPTQVMFEGDVDNDGIVDSVAYGYVTAAPAGTPAGITCSNAVGLGCFVRAQSRKLAGSPLPTANGGVQTTLVNYNVALENVTAPTANSPVFSYFDASGNAIDASAGLVYPSGTLASIRTVKVALNLQGASPDLQTRQRPTATLTLTSRLNNY